MVICMVKDMRELPCRDKFRQLDIFSFEHRWLRGDIISAYSIFHDRLDLPWVEFFEPPAERSLRKHDFKLCHTFALEESSPFSWMKLQIEIVSSLTLDRFKCLKPRINTEWYSVEGKEQTRPDAGQQSTESVQRSWRIWIGR